MTANILSGRRVLVVEDEMLVSMLIEDMLADLGCTTLGPVTRLERALALAREAPLDAAILDVNLDGKDTYAVADALAARRLPYVFATGYGAAGLRPGYETVPLLPKPFRKQDLTRALTRALQQALPS